MTGLDIPCRALLFDSDGVLVDSDATVELSWTRWASEYGLDPAVVLAMVHGRRSADTVARLIEPALQARALADIDSYEIEDAAAVLACPGAVELLASLTTGAWAIVTSGTRALATERLRAAGLPVPPVLITAQDVPRGKPDPAGYLHAARSLGRTGNDCVVLEDSPAGIVAGCAAGAAVVGVSHRALGTEATVVVKDLSGLSFTGTALRIPTAARLDG